MEIASRTRPSLDVAVAVREARERGTTVVALAQRDFDAPAIVFDNDLMALGGLIAAGECGLRVPADVAGWFTPPIAPGRVDPAWADAVAALTHLRALTTDGVLDWDTDYGAPPRDEL